MLARGPLRSSLKKCSGLTAGSRRFIRRLGARLVPLALAEHDRAGNRKAEATGTKSDPDDEETVFADLADVCGSQADDEHCNCESDSNPARECDQEADALPCRPRRLPARGGLWRRCG